jgi:plasmid stabilization system protein ParE
MNNHDFFFSHKAVDTFRQIILDMQEVSLVAAESVRAKIFHKLHLIQHHPLQSSKEIELSGINGHFRLTTVLNYKIYYKVEESRILVVDILTDKSSKGS